ncbi:hypothetical protein ACJMK2_025780 [Sinanodonta woodiana]|uniref:Uncharacterized protein n=1 Tax=Sinanodonta woodiana TaxID=1069815 RepID=A0ABD3XHK1_SINWO
MHNFLTNTQSFIFGPSRIVLAAITYGMLPILDSFFFGLLKETGYFEGDTIDKNIIQFVFMSILQEDIDQAVTVWNNHCICPSKKQNVPSGRPCVLYTMPLLYGTQDYVTNVDPDTIIVCKDKCWLNQNKPSDPELQELFQILMEENNLEIMRSPEDALNTYKSLRRLALQALYS